MFTGVARVVESEGDGASESEMVYHGDGAEDEEEEEEDDGLDDPEELPDASDAPDSDAAGEQGDAEGYGEALSALFAAPPSLGRLALGSYPCILFL